MVDGNFLKFPLYKQQIFIQILQSKFGQKKNFGTKLFEEKKTPLEFASIPKSTHVL